MKKAHKLNEDVEKERKQSPIRSVCERLSSHSRWLVSLSKSLTEDVRTERAYNPFEHSTTVKNVTQMYESIRYDYRKTLEIKDEDFERLFPKIEVKTFSIDELVRSLQNITEQEIHMKLYCNRYLY